jgi:hypothetical protein
MATLQHIDDRNVLGDKRFYHFWQIEVFGRQPHTKTTM